MLLVGNKADLDDEPPLSPHSLPSVSLSALRAAHHIDELTPIKDWLIHAVASGLSDAEATPIVVNQRHRQHLAAALTATRQVKRSLAMNQTGELLALDLRTALDELGAVTGEITNEEVLGTIFSRFCIGK